MMSSNKRLALPRRTQEFETSMPQSSVKKPQNRVSRIAQPVRKSSKTNLGLFGENGRSRSMERGLNAQPIGVPSTATKKSLNLRSSSATPQLRTPLRNVGYALNAENVLAVPSTVERERCSAEARKVFDYLSEANVTDLPKDFIVRGSMKAMSMKQFLIIVAHLFRQIGGTRYKIGSNFIEDIMKAISELQCPFMVNKSMLKTPSAPHSINQVITMLSWLIDLAPEPISESEWAPNYLQAPEFPSKDFTQLFFQSSIESFHLWNLKKEEEFGEKVEAMVDQLVSCTTNGLDQALVRQRTEEIQKLLEEIDVDRTDGRPREQSFEGVQQRMIERQHKEKQLADETKKLSNELERQEQEYYQRQDQYYECESVIRKLKEELARQQMTVAERDQLRHVITRNKNLISAKRNAVASLEEESSDYQITLSRLIKQKINLISELNTKLYQFSNTLQPDIKFIPMEISLTTENYPALEKTLQELEVQLQEVLQQCRALYLKLSQEKCHLEQQLADIQLNVLPLEAQIGSLTERKKRLQQQREMITQELGALVVRSNERENQKEREKELELTAAKIQKQLESNRKAIDKLALDKEQLKEDGLEQCRVALAERQRKLAAVRSYVEGCEAIMNKISHACSLDPIGESME